MYIEKKAEIKSLINQLELSVASNDDELFVKDKKYPNLILWSKYQKYLNGVLLLFEPKEKREYKNLEEVITLLELDEFYVCAKGNVTESKLELQNYIQRIKEKIGA